MKAQPPPSTDAYAPESPGWEHPGRIALAAAFVVTAVLLAWLNSFSCPFILDDVPAITENPTIHGLWPPGRLLSPPPDGRTVSGRPVLNASFALNWALGRDAVQGYHAVNVAIHALASLALLGVVRRTLSRPALRPRFGAAALPLATAAALLWAVHPLVTESVTYVAQRAESLAGLFYLLTLYGFIRSLGSEPHRRAIAWQAFALAACLLGMASKETMVSAPLMVLLYDRTLGAGTFREALKKRGRFYAGLAACWILLAWLVVRTGTRGNTAGFGLGVGPWAYALTQCGAIVRYLGLAIWPHPLVLDYGIGIGRSLRAVAPQAVLLIGLVSATAVAIWKNRPIGLAGAWFFALLAPSSSIVPVVTQTIAEHRMYLPLASLAVVAVCSAYRLLGWRALVPGLAAAIALTLATVARNADYSSDLALWRATAARRPANPRAWEEWGAALVRHGHPAEAIVKFERALALLPDYPLAHGNLAEALAESGRLEDALREYAIAVRGMPQSPEPNYGMGNALVKQRRFVEAAACYEQAIRLDPGHVRARNNLGNVLETLGRRDEAVKQFEAAIRLAPDMLDARFNLANALARLGRLDEAIVQYREVLKLAPGSSDAHANLGVVLVQSGRSDEGVRELETAVRIDPSNAGARGNLERLKGVSSGPR